MKALPSYAEIARRAEANSARPSCAEIAKQVGISAARVYELRKRGDSDDAILSGAYKRSSPRYWGKKRWEAEKARRSKVKAELHPRSVEIGRRVKAARVALGMEQLELARLTGIHRPNVSRVESGRHTPTLEVLCRIALALKCDVGDLVRGVEVLG